MRYDIKGKKYIDTPSKYYFTDRGLRNARTDFRKMEESHTMENIIFNELKMRGSNVIEVLPHYSNHIPTVRDMNQGKTPFLFTINLHPFPKERNSLIANINIPVRKQQI